MRNRQWHIKTKGVGLRLSLDTCSASLNVALHVALHLWPKVVSGEHVICLVTAKVAHKASTMMWISLLLIQPLYLQQHTYKDPSQDLVPNNLTIRYFRFLELFLTYMRI